MSGYAVRNDGIYGWRSVESPADCLANETFQYQKPAEYIPSNNDKIKQQIAELESQQTERRIREATLGIDNGWLKNLNDQVTALRAQLS